MKKKSYTLTKYACYITTLSTAVTGNLSPLLFVTFRDMYGISYSKLGLLVVLNFGTQLLLDTVFSFFSHRFDLKRSIKLIPFIMSGGLVLFALSHVLFPGNIYLGLALSTVVFSAGGGLAEVLISPLIAAIPSPDAAKSMSRLHSCYAWGVLFAVLAATGFIAAFGAARWQLLTVLLTLIPATAAVLMSFSPIPPMKTPEKASGAAGLLKNRQVVLYILCIFLSGSSECTMSQWCPGYIETVLGIDKTTGNIFGLALFGAMLGFGRSLYGKIGKNIHKVLFAGSACAFVCYLVAALSPSPVTGLLACAFTGFFVSMLWPGSLIAVSGQVPDGGVALYAFMAMGGDMGASLCPQGVGIITDTVMASSKAAELAARLGISAEQLGMKAGMLFAALFPLAATVLFWHAMTHAKKER